VESSGGRVVEDAHASRTSEGKVTAHIQSSAISISTFIDELAKRWQNQVIRLDYENIYMDLSSLLNQYTLVSMTRLLHIAIDVNCSIKIRLYRSICVI
jgi:hypothetical protein